MAEIRVTDSLTEGQMLAVDQEGQKILLCRVSGRYHAISNICSHALVRLSDGKLRGTTIICPLHGARFDVTSGRCLGGPAVQDVACYEAREDNGEIIISTG